MSWAEVKKINSDLDMPLNGLIPSSLIEDVIIDINRVVFTELEQTVTLFEVQGAGNLLNFICERVYVPFLSRRNGKTRFSVLIDDEPLIDVKWDYTGSSVDGPNLAILMVNNANNIGVDSPPKRRAVIYKNGALNFVTTDSYASGKTRIEPVSDLVDVETASPRYIEKSILGYIPFQKSLKVQLYIDNYNNVYVNGNSNPRVQNLIINYSLKQ